MANMSDERQVWSGSEITQEFLRTSARHYHQGQGAEGIDLQAQFYVDGEPAVGWYVWVEAFVDCDMDGWFLLDVRDDDKQTRDYLLVRSGGDHNGEYEWQRQPISTDAPAEEHRRRMTEGLTWMANRIEAITETED